MDKHLEIEAKAMLSEEEYFKLLSLFKNPPYIQKNYYIDSKNRELHKKGVSLRLRVKENYSEFTVKIKMAEGREEINFPISLEDANDYINSGVLKNSELILLVSKYIKIDELKILTSLKTTRCDLELNNGLYSLDKNEYNGLTDYEIEFESDSIEKAKSLLTLFLAQKNIIPTWSTKTKTNRAISSI